MQTLSADEAKSHFGNFLDLAEREPVRVTKHDRVVGVIVSASDYDAMHGFYADCLKNTIDQTTTAAEQAGLTPEILEPLLADKS